MKRIFIYIIALICICFSIPIVFTKEFAKRTYSQETVNTTIIDNETAGNAEREETIYI